MGWRSYPWSGDGVWRNLYELSRNSVKNKQLLTGLWMFTKTLLGECHLGAVLQFHIWLGAVADRDLSLRYTYGEIRPTYLNLYALLPRIATHSALISAAVKYPIAQADICPEPSL